MAYTDDVPAVWNAWPLFKSASTSSMDTRLLLVGDSKINPDATSAPLGHGICRTWPVAAWSFISPRSGYTGSPAWMSNGFQGATVGGATITRNGRNAGATFTGGESLLYPVYAIDLSSAGNVTDGSAAAFSQCVLTDNGNYATANAPFSGVQCTSRLLYVNNPSGSMVSARVRSYRQAGTDASPAYTTVNTTSLTLNTGTAALPSYLDVDCGTGANAPGVGIIENSTDETSKCLYLGPPVFYRGTPGSRTTGFGFCHMATGSYTSENVLAAFGGGGSPTCSVANVRLYLQHAGFTPNFILLDVGQNTSGTENTELTAGTQTTYKANMQAILTQIATVYSGMSAPMPYIILCNPYATGYTTTHCETKGRALYNLARSNGCGFIDMFQFLNRHGTGTEWYTEDGIHPSGPAVNSHSLTGNGAECWAATLWAAGFGEYVGRLNSSSVRARMR